ncbi:hypothetical protein AWR27_21750 [Spirosoma montaniterrae]|uniref:SGNH hydrolase-type esterase domain-containing protein n=2 Tax=Spirosoma montaniterrae TaxID=1178516 RepID=A0A1P9X268_9BACT|nr:hypothetical protein AWR27_21750 [Spirosoma montaniterrae]
MCLLLAVLSACQKSTFIDPQPAQPFTPVKEVAQSPLVVILGSSTASGAGASDYKHAWAGLFSSYLNKGKIINLARGGYTTYHILPDGQEGLVAKRPSADTLRNITAALKLHPTLMIISMTTNDVANGYSVDEVMYNLQTIRRIALDNGVKRILITTSMPRKLNAQATARWLQQRDRTMRAYEQDAVNFFDPLADADNLFQANLTPDGIHPNDDGHRLLFKQLVSRLE